MIERIDGSNNVNEARSTGFQLTCCVGEIWFSLRDETCATQETAMQLTLDVLTVKWILFRRWLATRGRYGIVNDRIDEEQQRCEL